jgi:hypothetical protein
MLRHTICLRVRKLLLVQRAFSSFNPPQINLHSTTSIVVLIDPRAKLFKMGRWGHCKSFHHLILTLIKHLNNVFLHVTPFSDIP